MDIKQGLVARSADFTLRPYEFLGSCIEPAFAYTGVKLLQTTVCPLVIHHYLSFQIARQSQDLLSHVRLLINIQNNSVLFSSDILFQALLSFFWSLNGYGAALKKNMLLATQNELKPEQLAILEVIFNCDKSDFNQKIAINHFDVPSDFNSPVTSLMTRHEADSVARDPLIEAQEHIEYSQLDEAKLLLEQAIIKYPQRHDLHQELMGLYQSCRDSDQVINFVDVLSTHGITELCEQWLDCKQSILARGA